MLKIKVCGLRDLDNILEICNLDVDYVGLIFYSRSPRYVGDDIHKSWLDRIPDNIKKVGVFVNEDRDNVIETVHQYKLSFVQLHGNETPDYCKRLYDNGIKVIKAFSISKDFNFAETTAYEKCCHYFLFDTATDGYGGSGKKFSWDILAKYKGSKPFFLSGGISAEDGLSVKNLRHKQLFAVDINSKFEESPGFKNVAQVEKFVDAVKRSYS